MEHRAYGATGIKVSSLGLGAGQVGDAQLPEHEAESVLRGALDLGITLIDTARGYGQSEARIGRYLADRRSEFVLSTKVGYGVEGHPDWTPGCVRAGIERARTVMRTDVLDIVHLHSCPAKVMQDGGVVEALLDAQRRGIVRAVAYSGENDDLAYAVDEGSFDGFMASVNICDQRILDDALPAVVNQRFGFIAKRPIANAPWMHAERPAGQYVEPYWERFRAMGLHEEGASRGLLGGSSWDEVALRFAVFTSGVSACIVGTKSLEHLRANVGAVRKGPLGAEVQSRLRDLFRAHDAGWIGQV